MTAKQSGEAVEAVERRGQARQAEILLESGEGTWWKFTTPPLKTFIGVECRGAVGDNGHLTAVNYN